MSDYDQVGIDEAVAAVTTAIEAGTSIEEALRPLLAEAWTQGRQAEARYQRGDSYREGNPYVKPETEPTVLAEHLVCVTCSHEVHVGSCTAEVPSGPRQGSWRACGCLRSRLDLNPHPIIPTAKKATPETQPLTKREEAAQNLACSDNKVMIEGFTVSGEHEFIAEPVGSPHKARCRFCDRTARMIIGGR